MANHHCSVSVLTCTVMISIILVALQIEVVKSGGSSSRQEQEILLLDALSRKYSQSSSSVSNQFEPNSIMDMLGRSTKVLLLTLMINDRRRSLSPCNLKPDVVAETNGLELCIPQWYRKRANLRGENSSAASRYPASWAEASPWTCVPVAWSGRAVWTRKCIPHRIPIRAPSRTRVSWSSLSGILL